jgi:hypothetical protein
MRRGSPSTMPASFDQVDSGFLPSGTRVQDGGLGEEDAETPIGRDRPFSPIAKIRFLSNCDYLVPCLDRFRIEPFLEYSDVQGVAKMVGKGFPQRGEFLRGLDVEKGRQARAESLLGRRYLRLPRQGLEYRPDFIDGHALEQLLDASDLEAVALPALPKIAALFRLSKVIIGSTHGHPRR